nr:formate dehydrogenase [Geodermatophilaceae bacterium]
LEELGGLQWPCPDIDHPGSTLLHERLWADPLEGPPAPFHACEWVPPIDALDERFPLRMTTVRRLDAYNTGVQTDGYTSPLWEPESLRMAPEDATALGLVDGERVRVSSRRGSILAPLRVDAALRPGLTWMTPHATGEADVNVLTMEKWDPKSGTSEFKATAIRVDALNPESEVG